MHSELISITFVHNFLDDEYQNLLLNFGVVFDDLPLNIQSDLEALAELKLSTGIIHADITFLQEWYCQKAEQSLEKELAARNIQFNIEHLENELAEVRQTIQVADE